MRADAGPGSIWSTLYSTAVFLLQDYSPLLTVPQKGYAKNVSNRQINKTSFLSHLSVTFKSLKSNLFLEPILAHPIIILIIHNNNKFMMIITIHNNDNNGMVNYGSFCREPGGIVS